MSYLAIVAIFSPVFVFIIVGGIYVRRKGEQAIRASRQHLRDHGMDPDVPVMRHIAAKQAAERHGWHPVERSRMKALLKLWERVR